MWRRRIGGRAAGTAAALAAALVSSTTGCGHSDANPDARVTTNAVSERVIDGDTIEARVNGRSERVRLLGINTPESVDPRRPVECFGKEASARLAELLPPRTPIRLERDVEERDSYGRLLAYVLTEDGTLINVQLVAEGFAAQFTFPPNVAHTDEIRAAERTAREQRIGLWGSCDSVNRRTG